VEDWAEIRRLSVAEGLSGRCIARRLGVSRVTVARALAQDRPPKYDRARRPSIVDPYVDQMRVLLAEYPKMPATVLAERVGFNDGRCTTVFRQRVAVVKAELGMVDPADRLVFAPGEQFQCDLWFPGKVVGEQGLSYPVVTMIACYSRRLEAVMIPSRVCGDILSGMNVLLTRFDGLPKALLWDNEAGLVSGHRLIAQSAGWAGALGVKVKLAKPRDPETKGRIERANGYLGTSFLPGRRFASIEDFNTQLESWLSQKANHRTVRALGYTPYQVWDHDYEKLIRLPDLLPAAGLQASTRLGRDYYVRLDSADYSVDPHAIGRIVDVHGSLDRVRVTCEGRVVADHKRCFCKGSAVCDPAHVQSAKALRENFQAASRANTRTYDAVSQVAQADLASYDTLWDQTRKAAR
jgi:transposase